MKLIEKKTVAPVEPITGSIVDTTNINDKTKNTYSANVIDNLIETITNDNGTAIKFPDGTMICRGTYIVNTTTNVALAHGGYRTLGQTIKFPATFIDKPTVSVCGASNVNDNGFLLNTDNLSTTQFAGAFWTIVKNETASDHTLSYIAIGRWK